MRIEINGIEWLIEEVEENSDNLKIDGKLHWGTCNYDKQVICICKEMKISKKKQTLIHELTHAFAFEHSLNGYKEWYSNEEMCEFLSQYAERIINIANKYIDVKYKYTKGC